jgi:competence protein ComEC
MEDFVFANVPEPQASIISCVLLGNRAAVPQEIEDAFQRTGTIHILSVSGLHMALLAGALWFALQWLGVRRKVAAALVLVFVCYYAAMTGATAPPLRAGVMAAVMCLGVILDRRQQLLNSLGLAALVLLVMDPNDVFNVGFQLSFLCVLGMSLFYVPILNALPGGWTELDALETGWATRIKQGMLSGARKCVAVSLAAQIATAPLVAYNFHLFTPLAVFNNVHIIPTAWLALVVGMILVTLGALLPVAAPVIAFPLNAVTWVFVRQVSVTSHLPYSAISVVGPNVPWLIAYFLFLGALVWRNQLGLSVGKLAILGLLLAVTPMYWWLLTPPRDNLKITCFDVGHGNSILLQLPGDHAVLYDCGTLGNYDVGRNVVAPYLWEEGIARLDAVILSHAHTDHLSGFSSLVKAFDVGALIIGPGFSNPPLGQAVTECAERHRIPILEAAAGDTLVINRIPIRVMHPPLDRELVRLFETNDQSLVIEVNAFDRPILLTGDAGELACRIMFRGGDPARCAVVQIPHHGAQAKVAELLAEQVRPLMALISSKTLDESRSSREALRQRGVLPFATARSGAVQIAIRPDHIRVHCFADDQTPRH